MADQTVFQGVLNWGLGIATAFAGTASGWLLRKVDRVEKAAREEAEKVALSAKAITDKLEEDVRTLHSRLNEQGKAQDEKREALRVELSNKLDGMARREDLLRIEGKLDRFLERVASPHS